MVNNQSKLSKISEGSRVYFCINKIYGLYSRMVDIVLELYQKSRTANFIKVLYKFILSTLNNSCFGTIVKIIRTDTSLITNNSVFFKILYKPIMPMNRGLMHYARASLAKGLVLSVKERVNFSMLRIISIFISIVISIDLFFVLTDNSGISLIGLIIRIAFLFIGLCGCFHRLNWNDITEASFVVRWMHNYRN